MTICDLVANHTYQRHRGVFWVLPVKSVVLRVEWLAPIHHGGVRIAFLHYAILSRKMFWLNSVLRVENYKSVIKYVMN